MMINNNKAVSIFKALADPIRIKIIKYLKEIDSDTTCGKIGNELKINKTTGSYHFKILEEADLISTKKISREKYVKLNLKTLDKYVSNFLNNL